MIGKILLVFMGLFVQEMVSLSAIVFATQHGIYPVLFTHALFVVATIIDIGFGFWIGTFLKNKTGQWRVGRYVDSLSNRFSLTTKKYRRWTALFILGNLSFPYVNACIAGYLGLSFWESAVFIFIGDAIWYVCDWFVVAGISSVVKNTYVALAAVLVIAAATTFVIRKLNGRKI